LDLLYLSWQEKNPQKMKSKSENGQSYIIPEAAARPFPKAALQLTHLGNSFQVNVDWEGGIDLLGHRSLRWMDGWMDRMGVQHEG
jgi:hypothetical protein